MTHLQRVEAEIAKDAQMKYRVSYEIRAHAIVEVEAENEEAAIEAGMEEAWESANANATLYDAGAKEI